MSNVTTTTTIPKTSLSIAQSIAKIETKAEFKAFMVATFNYDKKLSPSQIVLNYSAKTGFEIEDTDDFKAVLSNIAKDSDINTSPETPQTLPIVEQKDIRTFETINKEFYEEFPNVPKTTETTNDDNDENDEKKYLDKIECIKGKLKLRPVGDELTTLAIDYSPLFARLKKGEKLTNIEVASELHPVFDTLQISILLNCHKGGIEKSLKEKGLYTGTGVTRTKSVGEGSPRVKVTTLESMRKAIDAKKERILTLQAEILEDEKAYNAQIETERENAKEAAKDTLSSQIAKFKELGMSIEDILALIHA